MEAYASGGWADVDNIGEQLNSYIAKGFKGVNAGRNHGRYRETKRTTGKTARSHWRRYKTHDGARDILAYRKQNNSVGVVDLY
jgi:hypothetical protein